MNVKSLLLPLSPMSISIILANCFNIIIRKSEQSLKYLVAVFSGCQRAPDRRVPTCPGSDFREKAITTLKLCDEFGNYSVPSIL